MMKSISGIIFLVVVLLAVSCKKDVITDDPAAKLSFSTDTLTFDTVFTQLGSATRRFMIYNRNPESILVSSIKIAGGSASNFRINVNGQPGTSFSNIEIRGNDSMFVFAEVTVDPNSLTNPFVIFESVEFLTNGNAQQVVLSAWGQNAYYYRPNLFIDGLPPISLLSDYFPNQSVVNLPSDKPHVIFGFLMVDSAVTLNIAPGTQLHFYDKSGLWAYRGATLNVNGDLGNEVVFQGTRLEDFFDDLPGQWDRIILNEGPSNHSFSNVIIKNSFIGIQAEEFYLDGIPELATNKVVLYNTIIQNCSGLGLLARNHNITANNVLVANAGNILVALQGGGTHHFLHSTIANFWRFGNRSDESLLLTNYFLLGTSTGQLQVVGNLKATFENSIVYGTNEEELATDSVASSLFDYTFENCVLKTEKDTLDAGLTGKFQNMILNPSWNSFLYNNPLFVNPYEDDFLLHEASAAINRGNPALTDTLLLDLKGDTRDGQPDVGAFEF
jgi:hypothetical protein